MWSVSFTEGQSLGQRIDHTGDPGLVVQDQPIITKESKDGAADAALQCLLKRQITGYTTLASSRPTIALQASLAEVQAHRGRRQE